MNTPQLGRLETVDARMVWINEGRDFTPWLRDNIDLLGDALGLELEISASEAPVGNFAVDLLGKDISNNRTLIIENQLEQTNHGHLGQLITYAAGLDAGAIVWITPQFRDEHRQALDWLNAHTGEGIDFFGVEIELLRINDSLPAPHFKLVAQPNEWAKTTRAAAAVPVPEPSERGLARQQFFQAVLDEARRRQPGLTNRSRVGGTDNWFSLAAGRAGFGLVWSIPAGGRLRVELDIDTGDAARNKGFYEALLERKSEIETRLDFPLEWERLEHARRSRVAAYRPGRINDPPEQLAGHQEWAVDTMIRMGEVLRPIVRELQPLAAPDDMFEPEDGESDP